MKPCVPAKRICKKRRGSGPLCHSVFCHDKQRGRASGSTLFGAEVLVPHLLRTFLWIVVVTLGVTIASDAQASRGTLPVVMLSDLHFDPFHDPAKLAQLRATRVEGWAKVLEEPASPKQAADFGALQTSCKARGEDSSWGVLVDSLRAAHRQQMKPLFVTVSGDLLAHGFDCRFKTLLPGSTEQDATEFAEKTVAFVALALRHVFPGTPVYIALGNNDSSCTDYQETPGSEFLRSAARSFASDVPDEAAQQDIRTQFNQQGDYDVAMPKALPHARMIVLQNIFQSRYFEACGGKHDPKSASDQIAWLRDRLTKARERHEAVWVMAHIPPGVDVYSSFHKFVLNPAGVCSVQRPSQLLGSEAFADVLADFSDVVRLAIFAHTHMDEVKLLHNDSGAAIAAKLVPSVSPVNGNTPAFLVGRVNPTTATLVDYSAFARGTASGVWSQEYDFGKLYGLPDYSAASVKKLTGALAADKGGDSEVSRNYAKWFYPGDPGLYALGLHQIWPAYACATAENGGTAFHECMCPKGNDE